MLKVLAAPRVPPSTQSTRALALLLAGVGVYGLMAHYAGQRRDELGVRMALGASAGDVMRLAVGHGMKLAVIGIVLGLTGAVTLSRVIESAMLGVIALEYPLFVAVTILLVVVAFLATLVPATRASRLDPTLLRRELHCRLSVLGVLEGGWWKCSR